MLYPQYSPRRRRIIGVYKIPIITLRRSTSRLRFMMGIPIPVRRRLFVNRGAVEVYLNAFEVRKRIHNHIRQKYGCTFWASMLKSEWMFVSKKECLVKIVYFWILYVADLSQIVPFGSCDSGTVSCQVKIAYTQATWLLYRVAWMCWQYEMIVRIFSRVCCTFLSTFMQCRAPCVIRWPTGISMIVKICVLHHISIMMKHWKMLCLIMFCGCDDMWTVSLSRKFTHSGVWPNFWWLTFKASRKFSRLVYWISKVSLLWK